MNEKILVPIITPFKEDETIDHEALKKLVRHLLDKGAGGIYAGGSTAECLLLSDEERKAALETVVKAADGACVIANIGTVGTRQAELLADHAAKAGANAISSVPPFYFRFSFEEIASYYRDLSRRTSLPMMIYNIPVATGCSFSLGQLEELLRDECVCSIKFTDTDYFMLEQLKSHTGKFIYSGKDEDFLSALAAGADGGIGTTFNCMVDRFTKVLALFEKNEIAAARRVQHKINEVVRAVCDCGLIESVKYILSLQGIPCGHARRPFRRLTEENKKKLEGVLIREGIL